MKNFKKLAAMCCAAALGTGMVPMTAGAEASGVVINEVCAKNTQYAAPDGNYYDWIELYNPTGNPVDLSGCGLSDKDTNPYKYTFPANTVIGSGQRLMVFCDSKIEESAAPYAAPYGLSTSGETIILTSAEGNVIDTVSFGQIETNMTYGRVPDGSDKMAFMQMTPDAENRENNVVEISVPKPVLSQEGGFYSSGFQLSLSAQNGAKIYYTLDGSTPTTSSAEYTSPIDVSDPSPNANVLSAITDIVPPSNSWMGGGGGGATPPNGPVDKAFIVNAIAVDNEGHVSDVTTGTYFIDYDNKASYYKDMKVISIVTDSDNLFDYEKGIYVMGKTYDDWKATQGGGMGGMVQAWETPANYTQKGALWERPATMQIFEDGQLAHSQGVGLRIHGGATRSSAQKSFNVYARSEYGASKFEFDLFDGSVRSEVTGKKIKEFDSFMIRNTGNDAEYARFRDKLNQGLVRDREILTQGMESCVVFIDGEFWGHYEITEKIDEEFVNAHYKVGKKNVCIVKNEELDAGDEETFAEWEQMAEWVKSTDFTADDAYAQLCEKIDMRSFADYMSAEFYYNNSDWGNNNTGMWKSTAYDPENPYSDGKWRFILFDTEYSCGLYGQTPANTDSINQLLRKNCFVTDLFKGAMKNAQFKRLFSTVYMDMANENFNFDRVNAMISAIDSELATVSAATHDRFWYTAATAGGGGGWGGIGGGWGGIGGGGFPGMPGGPGAETPTEAPTEAPTDPPAPAYDGKKGPSEAAVSNYNNNKNTVTDFYRSRYQTARNSLKNYAGLGSTATITIKNDASKGSVSVNTLNPDFSGGSWSGEYFTDYPVVLKASPVEGGAEFSYWELSDGTKIGKAEAEIEFTGNMTVTAVYGDGSYVPPQEIAGDINSDGKADVADLVLLEKHLLASSKLNTDQLKKADVTGDNRVDTFDLVKLRKIVINK